MTQVVNTIEEVREVLKELRKNQQKFAFVPTMGNLHAGHLQLVAEAKKHADIVVVSIFVNPLQFNQITDLENYPRTLDDDIHQLESIAVDVVFTPSDKEIYPHGMENQTRVQVPYLSTILEGESRPGHFDGVSTIVNKLFNIVQPDVAIFGEKDYQQLQLIKKMATDLSMPITIIGVPTVREKNGLAMSSRNHRLSAAQRELASVLHQILQELKTQLGTTIKSFEMYHEMAKQKLESLGFILDNLFLQDADTLEAVNKNTRNVIILIAAYLGDVRLIDNISYSIA